MPGTNRVSGPFFLEFPDVINVGNVLTEQRQESKGLVIPMVRREWSVKT